MALKNLESILLIMVAVIMSSCQSTQDPPPSNIKGDHRYWAVYLPSEAGSTDVELSSSVEDDEVSIEVLTVSPAIILQSKENWSRYEVTGLTLLPEHIYEDAGYNNYPNTLDFGYTFQWATFYTYKYPGTDRGVLRIVFDKNKSVYSRRIYLYINGYYKETIEVEQNGMERKMDGLIRR